MKEIVMAKAAKKTATKKAPKSSEHDVKAADEVKKADKELAATRKHNAELVAQHPELQHLASDPSKVETDPAAKAVLAKDAKAIETKRKADEKADAEARKEADSLRKKGVHRAKYRVDQVMDVSVVLSPVSECQENIAMFNTRSASGSLSMNVHNAAVRQEFEVGDEWFVDMCKVEKE